MAEFLLPALDDDSAGFWEGCRSHELRVQRCDDCGHPQFPPRQMCPVCQSTALSWQKVSGHGHIWSFVVPHPPLLPAYAELAPYNVIVVALDEDPTLRMVGNLVAGEGAQINSVDPATIEIGMAVTVVFDPPVGATESTDAEHRDEGIVFPRWVTAD